MKEPIKASRTMLLSNHPPPLSSTFICDDQDITKERSDKLMLHGICYAPRQLFILFTLFCLFGLVSPLAGNQNTSKLCPESTMQNAWGKKCKNVYF